jgi:hypothetical protein
MDNDKMREELEQSPRFRGMDFQRAPEAPDYYLSPYANGAWDGWKASRAAVEIELPALKNSTSYHDGGDQHDELVGRIRKTIEAAGLKVKP